MNDNVRKVFDILGVEPNKHFKIGITYNIPLNKGYKIIADV